LVNLSPDIVYVYDLVERRNVFSNRGVEHTLGYSTAEVLALGDALLGELMHPADLETYREQILPRYASEAEGAVLRHQYRMRHKSGAWRWLESTEVIYERDASGAPKRLFGITRDVTDRVAAAEALELSEATVRTLLENLNAAVVHTTLRGEFLRINRAAVEMARAVSADEFMKRNAAELYADPEDRVRLLKELREKGSVQGMEVLSLRHDGSPYWLSVNAVLLTTPASPEPTVLAILSDVTRAKNVELALRESESALKQSQRVARIGHYVLSFQTGHWSSSETLDEIFGVDAGYQRDVSGWLALVHPEDREGMQAYFTERVLGRRQPFDRRYRVVAPSTGEVRWVHGLGHLEAAPDGSLLRMFGTIQDITLRKQAEDELRRSEGEYRLLAENVSDVISRHAADGRYTFLSPACRTVLGYDAEELRGTHPAALLHPEDEDCADLFRVSGAGRATGLASYRMRRRDGSYVWLETNRRELSPPLTGDAPELVCITRDVTARREADEALRIAQRLESLGVLAGGIAHDFNNLLGGMFGYVESAQESLQERDLPAASEALELAFSVFERAQGLTRELLTFAKGGAPIQKPLDVGTLVRKSAQFALSGTAVALRFDLPDDLWSCDADENQLAQVIDNIVINARQSSEEGGRIEISGRNVLQEPREPGGGAERWVRISVRDFGPGVPPEIRSRIFDPFFTTKERGHGLGLATAYSIVQRHGGTIEVESELGRGAVFHISLPAGTQRASPSYRPPPVEATGTGRILIMDDEEFLRGVLERMLASLGYAVTVTRDGDEAVECHRKARAERAPFLCSIFDLTVRGGMGGEAAAQLILAEAPESKLIVVSGYSDDPVIANPAAHGFAGRLVKPFRRDDLALVLARLDPTRRRR
jgi:PAS domain S-box-containing protein